MHFNGNHFNVGIAIIDHPFLMVGIPPIYGDYGDGSWHCYTNIRCIWMWFKLEHPKQKPLVLFRCPFNDMAKFGWWSCHLFWTTTIHHHTSPSLNTNHNRQRYFFCGLPKIEHVRTCHPFPNSPWYSHGIPFLIYQHIQTRSYPNIFGVGPFLQVISLLSSHFFGFWVKTIEISAEREPLHRHPRGSSSWSFWAPDPCPKHLKKTHQTWLSANVFVPWRNLKDVKM